jgi:hypothetical protein
MVEKTKSDEADVIKKLAELDMSFEIKAPTMVEPSLNPSIDPILWAKVLKNLDHAEMTKKLVIKLQTKVLILEMEVRKIKD